MENLTIDDLKEALESMTTENFNIAADIENAKAESEQIGKIILEFRELFYIRLDLFHAKQELDEEKERLAILLKGENEIRKENEEKARQAAANHV